MLPALPGAPQAQVTALQVPPGALEQELFPCCHPALHKQVLPEPPGETCSPLRHILGSLRGASRGILPNRLISPCINHRKIGFSQLSKFLYPYLPLWQNLNSVCWDKGLYMYMMLWGVMSGKADWIISAVSYELQRTEELHPEELFFNEAFLHRFSCSPCNSQQPLKHLSQRPMVGVGRKLLLQLPPEPAVTWHISAVPLSAPQPREVEIRMSSLFHQGAAFGALRFCLPSAAVI